MQKFYIIILTSFLLLSNSLEAIAREFDQEEEQIQVSADPAIETAISTTSSSDIQNFEENKDTNKPHILKSEQVSNKDSSDDPVLLEEANFITDNSSLKNMDGTTRSIGGQLGSWFIINGQYMNFDPTINVVKNNTDPIVFSKIISQTSGSSTNFPVTILFSDAIAIQSFPEITVPTNTTYTIQYSVDKSTFDNVPPADITQLKGIKVVFSKMVPSERVEIKNTALIDWENTDSGKNELAQFFLESFRNGTVFFDSYRMVTAAYVDELGNDLIDPKIFYGKLGQDYNTSELEIPNYKLISIPKNATGKFLEQDQVVTYIYERIEGAPVIVDFINTEGNELAPSETLIDKAGLPYKTTAKDIPGWKLTETPANAAGTFSEEAQTVSYVYDRAEAIPVAVQYLDAEGNEVAPSETLTGKIGLPYKTAAKDIPGWKLTETPANAAGTFSEEAQTVSYVYDRAEAVPIAVQYLDAKGNEVAPSETLTGKVGLKYKTAAKDISGWKLTETPTNATGTFSEEAQTVSYIYTNDLGKESTKNPTNHSLNKNKSPENSKKLSVQQKDSSQQLPLAGDKTTSALSILGIIVLTLFSILYFYKEKSNI